MRHHEQGQDDRDNEEADGSSGRELRHRAASSAAAAPEAGRLQGERGRRCHSSADIHRPDVSALSVEIAVATVQNNERQQRQQREQHHAAQSEHHVPGGLTGVGTTAAAAAGAGSRKAPHRRASSLVSRVFGGSAGSSAGRGYRAASLEERHGRDSSSTDRASSTDRRREGDEEKQAEQLRDQEEEEEEEEDSQHQHVVRRHEPQRSVPSVVDLFRLEPSSFTQPTTPAAALPSPLVAGRTPPAVSASLSAEDLAASLQAFSVGQHQQQQTSPAARYAPYTPPPLVYRDESAATVAPSPTPPDGSNHHHATGASRRGRSGGDDARSSASPRGRISDDGRHQPHQGGDQQQQGVLPPPRPLEVCTAVPVGITARDEEQQQLLYGGVVTYPLRGGGDDDDDDDDAEGEEDEDDRLGAMQQQQQQQEELSLARHLREGSTNTVDAGREGRVAYGGGATADWGAGRSDEYHLRQREGGGTTSLDALEAGGVAHHHHRGSSETMKTMSRSGTPNSRCGTPGSSAGGRSRGGASASVASSYINSLGRGASGDGGGAGGGTMKRPSARLQNEAKHFSDQKRGVTTSYKSEELYKQYHRISFFLVVMGVVIGLGSHGIDEGIELFVHLGEEIMEKGGALLGGSAGAEFFFFLLYDIILTGIAAMLTAYFSPGVEGSGIPAMKYMMDTDDLANELRSFTLVAVVVKACGLMLAAGGGLNVGREGPYTHLAGMVSYQLIRRVPFFNDILKKETVLRQVLAASVAVGLSSTFAATIGGVLFSIEITTLYYDVGNYFKAFVAAISGTVAVSVVRHLAEFPEYIERDFSKDEFEVWQYPVFATMGVLCGLVGPLYINFRLNMLKLGRKLGKHSIRAVPARRWEYVRAATAVACLAAAMTAVLSFFPGRFTRLTPLTTFKQLLSKGDLSSIWTSGFTDNIFIALPVSIVTWIITAAIGTSVTVPSGDFIQTTVIGATVGRLIGEVLAVNLSESRGVVPSTFALVGAAAMSCGATQTISAAVVILEMTGSFDLDKPVLLAAVVACGFSRKFGLNIYDSVMRLNGLESLYGLDMRRSEEMTAKDIMETDLKVVPCQTTIGELIRLLKGGEGGLSMFESYPVVTGLEGMAFVGTVSRKDLVHIVLTGGSETCCDSDAYFDYVVDKLPKKDVSASWDRLGEGLHSKDKTNLFARLPDHVKQAVEAAPAANTVRALRLLGDKIGNMASDLSFIRGGGSTLGRRSGRNPGSVTRSNRDTGDRREATSSRMTLNTLFEANWDPDRLDDPFGGRPVDLTAIAQRATGDVQIDRSVWKAHENMPLKNVYLLFANLRCIRLFIISGDRLTGIISRSILFNAMSKREGLLSLIDTGRSIPDKDRGRARASRSVSAKEKKHWVDVFFGERSRRGPHQAF